MKYTLLAVCYLTFLSLNAQSKDDCGEQPNSVKIQNATTLLNDCIADINGLNEKITTCLVVGAKSSEINAYAERLIAADTILARLSVVDAKFTCLINDNPREADYCVKAAYAKLTALAILNKKQEYLDYLKIAYNLGGDARKQLNYADPEKFYTQKLKDWGLKEQRIKLDANKLYREIQDIDSKNADASIIKGILDYYDNVPNTEANFKKTLDQLQKNALKTNTVDQRIGFVESWLAYIEINKRQFNEAKKLLDSIQILSIPDKSISWAMQSANCIDNKLSNGVAINPIGYNLPEESSHLSRYSLQYEKVSANNKPELGFKLIEDDSRIDTMQPQLLTALLKIQWNNLLNLEKEVLQRAERASAEGLKKAFKDPDLIYYVKLTDITSKKDLQNECELYRKRFDKALPVVQGFIYQRKAWTSLIDENPNEPYYHIMRIKANLALVYIKQHQASFTGFLDYYKLDKKLINEDDKTTINQVFAQSGIESELNEDLQACFAMDSSDIMAKIAKIENIQFSEEVAKGLMDLTVYKKTLPAGNNINGITVKSLIVQALAYLYFKDNYGSDLKVQIGDMAGYTNLDEAQKTMKLFLKYKTDEQNNRNGKSN